jgi:hypothetical protein
MNGRKSRVGRVGVREWLSTSLALCAGARTFIVPAGYFADHEQPFT